jgi:K+-transporting ATPase ATPase A chain
VDDLVDRERRRRPIGMGAVVTKKRVPVGAGTLPTHTPLFVFWLVGVVIVIGALTFFPALALGPIVEHLQLYGGVST